MKTNNIKKYLLISISIAFVFFAYAKNTNAAFIVNRPLYVGLTNGLVGYWSFDGKDIAINSKAALRRLMSVEPRRIALLYPSANHGSLTRGGPLNSTKMNISVAKIKRKPEINLGLSEQQSDPWLAHSV